MTTPSTAVPTGTLIQPYLFFPGNCEEAVHYYTRVLGAKVDMMMKFKESPDKCPEGMLPPGYDDKIMHASFSVGGALVMASDGCGDSGGFKGFSLSLAVPTEAEADRVFAALSEGGSVQMPLGKTFWSPKFGMLTDKYGVAWMVSVISQHG